MSLLEQLEDSNVASSTTTTNFTTKSGNVGSCTDIHLYSLIIVQELCQRIKLSVTSCKWFMGPLGELLGGEERKRERERERELKRVPTNTYNQLFIKGNPSISWGM